MWYKKGTSRMWRVMMTLYFIYIFKVFIIVPGLTDRSLTQSTVRRTTSLNTSYAWLTIRSGLLKKGSPYKYLKSSFRIIP